MRRLLLAATLAALALPAAAADLPRYITPPDAAYPPELLSKCISAEVRLRVLIDKGKAADVSIATTSGYVAFDDAAIAAMRRATWEVLPEPALAFATLKFRPRGC